MRSAAAAIILALGLIFPLHGANAAIDAVWANDGADKVTQDELRASNGTPVVNSLWNGTTVSLFGARNEIVNFNLILEAPANPATNVGVSISNLTGPGGSIIRYSPHAANDLFNWSNTEIEIFYVRYLQINGSSAFGGSLAGFQEPTFPARSQCPSGEAAGCAWTDRPVANKFYPDIAVPIELAPNFSIATGNNQSIWVDVYIPATAAAGTYTGTVTISENGVTTQTVPVSLKVRNFSLPDIPNSKTMLYTSTTDLYPRYGNSTLLPMQNQMRVAHRHKISLIDNNWDDGWPHDTPATQWIPFLDGSAFTLANGYAGPGAGVGNGVFSIGTYGQMTSGITQSAFTAHFNNWETWFEANSPLTERFVYLCDETGCQNGTPDLPTQLGWWSAIAGPGKNLPTMATQPLLNAAPTALSDPTSTYPYGASGDQAAADSVKAGSPARKLFAYNGGRPGAGSFATEDVGVALRELPWSQYKKNVDRWFFWEATYYNNYQYGRGNTDVLNSAQTFGPTPAQSLSSSYGQANFYNNGDGLLFYPGTDLLFPSSSYGINGPIASLRLKHWRRGIQDIDYLVLASQINPTAVQNLVNQMVPKALWENLCHDPNDCSYFIGPVSWSENPDDWESARSQLASIIESANMATTATSLTSSGLSTFGQSVTFTATVTASAGTPTGTVTFFPFGTGTLSNGTATFSTASLSAGSHSIIAIYNGDSNSATSTSAPLTQTVSTGTLQVSPTTDMTATGNQGGPFSPSSFSYQLSADSGSIGYSISGVPNWLTASSTSGTVTTTPATITFTVNSAANSLAASNYTATITFTNSTNGQGNLTVNANLTVNPVSVLQVSPSTSVSASGNQGGPFSPSLFSYQLSSSVGTLNYSIAGVPNWLTASSTSGSVTTSPTTVTFNVNSNANSLSTGNYTATIGVSNTTNSQGNQNISAALSVTPTGAGGSPATRTWVSGVGDDGNNCSRTAPCKTFAGAILQTVAGGEIDALDPGGFGSVTITKAVTIDGGGGNGGQVASILASGTPGVVVNAATTDKVVLRNLDLQGIGSGTIGVSVIAASSVSLENVKIANFTGVCISDQVSAHVNLFLFKSSLQNCAGGGIVSSSSSGINRVNMSNSSIVQSGVGLTAGPSTQAMVYNSTISNNSGGGVLANDPAAQVSIDQSTISNNQAFGVHSTNSATVRMSNSSVAYNNGTGLLADASGLILTWTNNWVTGNSSDGARTGTIAPR